jgi:Flp pilus assembly pilin Flp
VRRRHPRISSDGLTVNGSSDLDGINDGAFPDFVVGNRRHQMRKFVRSLWNDQRGQDIAEYAVMLAVILVIVVGTVRLVGSNANNVFSSVASSVQ